jgi:hypothetical protein
MPAVYARLIEAGITGGVGGKRRFSTHYRVKMDSPSATRTAVLLCGLVPVPGAPHPENMMAVCTSVDAYRVEGHPYIWEVRAEWDYSTTNRRDPAEDQKPPDQRRPVWSFNFMPLPESRFYDLWGYPFVDTAGTIISPPPEIPIYVDEITIIRYESSLNRALDKQYLNAVNSDTWLGCEPYTALVHDIDVQEIYEQGQYWFQKKFVILVKPFRVPEHNIIGADGKAITKIGGWYPTFVLNAGSRMLVEDPQSPGTKIPATLKIENFIDGQPWPLDINGQPIPLVDGEFQSPLVYLKFATVYGLSFAPLNLVPPWV